MIFHIHFHEYPLYNGHHLYPIHIHPKHPPPCEVTISLSTETWRLRLRRNYGLVASGAHVLHGLEGTTVGPGAAGGAILNGNQNGGWWFEEFE